MISVRVPATSANLGPGFDALGLAVSLYNRFEVEEADGLAIDGCPAELAGPDNLFVAAYRRGLEELGLPFRGLRLRIEAEIPVARGLGSSAACIVGGLLAAGRGALGREALGRERILDLAAGLEGHPDNVAPALMGGFCAAIVDDGHVRVARKEVEDRLAFHALVPPFPLSTKLARAALPPELVFRDAVFNVGRASLVASAFMSGRYELLASACADRLHEPYRASLIPGFSEVVEAARAAGCLAVYLSGAGPTVMAVEEKKAGEPPNPALCDALDTILSRQKPAPWRRISLGPDSLGAVFAE